MIEHDVKPETAGWFALRAGKFTASRAGDLMAVRQDGNASAQHTALLSELTVERLTGECVGHYVTSAMMRGSLLEEEALEAYAFDTGADLTAIGYVQDEILPNTGCTPDAYVAADGLVEIKCPMNMVKHLNALKNDAHAEEYKWQVQHQLMVTGRRWCDLVSYDPRFPAKLQLAIKRITPDAALIDQLKAVIQKTDRVIEAEIDQLLNENELQ